MFPQNLPGFVSIDESFISLDALSPSDTFYVLWCPAQQGNLLYAFKIKEQADFAANYFSSLWHQNVYVCSYEGLQ